MVHELKLPSSLIIKLVGLLMALPLLLLSAGCVSTVTPIQVPVKVNGTSDMGSLVFDLVYDYEILQVSNVRPGDLSTDTIIQYNIDNPGHVIVGLVDSGRIQNEFTIVTIVFNVMQKDQTCTFRVEDIAAYHASTLDQLSVTGNAGEFDGDSFEITPPVISVIQ